MNPMLSLAVRVLLVLFVAYAAAAALAAVFQRRLIYFPATSAPELQQARARERGLVAWRSADGEVIGWQRQASAAANRLVVLHGNAGEAIDRGYYADLFGSIDGGTVWEVYLLQYPGFGARPGRPTERTLTAAAAEAVRELAESGDRRPVYLLGESLGSGAASAVAGTLPDAVAGLILVTPFTRLVDAAAAHFPWLPVRLLIRDRFDSVANLERFAGPVAVLVAGQDTVVPTALGRELYDRYDGPKRLWEVRQAGHNTILAMTGRETWEEISRFVTEWDRL